MKLRIGSILFLNIDDGYCYPQLIVVDGIDELGSIQFWWKEVGGQKFHCDKYILKEVEKNCQLVCY